MTKPSFGFTDIEPQRSAVQRQVDQAGERHGFVSREAPQRRKRRMGGSEPTDQFNLRAAIADINTFVSWCERERISCREGFSRLVQAIDVA